jgi:hypothetical protein
MRGNIEQQIAMPEDVPPIPLPPKRELALDPIRVAAHKMNDGFPSEQFGG